VRYDLGQQRNRGSTPNVYQDSYQMNTVSSFLDGKAARDVTPIAHLKLRARVRVHGTAVAQC
jgi:hypothetical protein